MNMKRTLSLLLAAVLALALLTGCGGKQASDSSPEDQTVPNEPAGKEGAAALGSLTSFSAGTLDGGTFTQEDIAAAVSASRVTVSRVLNDFAQNGWVALGYRTVTLRDPERLKKLCQL